MAVEYSDATVLKIAGGQEVMSDNIDVGAGEFRRGSHTHLAYLPGVPTTVAEVSQTVGNHHELPIVTFAGSNFNSAYIYKTKVWHDVPGGVFLINPIMSIDSTTQITARLPAGDDSDGLFITGPWPQTLVVELIRIDPAAPGFSGGE